ncbi:MAG: hypothetical protein JHC74_02815 [Thermoleophilia bacterium]|nr:hypothetical protein [Thermoleophilia bacterium]
MSKRTRRPSASIPDAEAAARARDRRLGQVIDGDVPVTAEEWALVETLAALRGDLHDEPPPADFVAGVMAMAERADAPLRRPSPGALVSWARLRLHRRRRTYRRVGLMSRRSVRRASRGERRLP